MQLKRAYQTRSHSDKENLFNREKKRYCKSIQFLPQPKEIMYKILLYLNPKEINIKFKSLNSQCYKMIDQQFWDFYDQRVGLGFNDLYEIQYRIIERRSKGSLYRVMHRLTEKQYILRSIDTIKSNSDYNDGYQTSLIRELTYLQILSQHPRIQQLLDVNIQGPNVKLIYEFIPQNLRDKLKQELSQEQIKNYFLQICQGVEFLHSNHIIHRNLKPDNILVGQGIKIGDLSLARKETFPIIKYTPEDPKDRMRSNREIKRLSYRAPELLVRKQYYATEIDIWSLGCILAELALGKPLFQSQTEIQHLFLVFQLLGTPKDGLSDQQDFNIKFPTWKGYGLNMNSMSIEQVNDLKKNRPNALKYIIQLNEVLGVDGINLLEQCLNLNPYERPSITQILQHPFLNSKPYNYVQNPRQFQIQDYLQFQQEITFSMRATLVDWLIDVSMHFQQQSETLHLAINIFDSVLSIVFSSKRSLQLYGITCLHLADLYYEVSREYYRQQNCESYSYITDDEYAPEEIIKASQIILKAMDYNLYLDSSLHYFNLEIQIRNIQDQQLVSTGLYLCDYYLMCYDLIRMDKRTLGFYIFLLSAWTCQVKIGSIDQLDIELMRRLKKSHDELKQNPNCGQLEACQQKHQKIVEIPEISDYIIQFFK